MKGLPVKNLRGGVGTVVVDLSDTVAEVEFVDEKGRTSSLATIEKRDLIRIEML